jgi:glutathione S-transferase
VTIPVSHYVEKARWALDRARIEYREEGHAPGFHAVATRRRGGTRTVPVLVADGKTYADSTDILRWVDAQPTGVPPLFPTEPDLAAEVAALEELYDRQVGVDARRLVYVHMIGETETLLTMYAARVPGWEARVLRLLWPVMRRGIVQNYRINPVNGARSHERLMGVFDDVVRRLADGRRYLVGDRFTAADLTFAALSGPVVAPPGYGGPLPAFDDLPAHVQAGLRPYREHAAADFARRIYAEHRSPKG